jgi:hypothetical protein
LIVGDWSTFNQRHLYDSSLRTLVGRRTDIDILAKQVEGTPPWLP